MATALFGASCALVVACGAASAPPLRRATLVSAVHADELGEMAPAHPVARQPSRLAPFGYSVLTVSAAQLGATWHPGCPVGPGALRALKMSFVGFDGRRHVGTLIVNSVVLVAVEKVFARLYARRFPISEMVPESAYRGNDNSAAAADDTSGFNCRYAVAAGPARWSVHAYGEAIDVNDVQNPYIDGATVIPPSGAVFRNRSVVRPGMAIVGGTLVEAFAAVGWFWGGRWSNTPDYQHFSLTGG